MAIQSVYVVCDDMQALAELCAGAKKLAEKVTAVVFAGEEQAKAVACGADELFYCPVSEEGSPEDWAAPIAEQVKKEAGAMVLVNNSIRGRCLAGKLAVRLDTAVLTGAADLAEENDKLVCNRTVYGGMAQRKQAFTAPYGVLALGSGVFEVETEGLPTAAVVAQLPGEPAAPIKRVDRQEKKEAGVNLAVAKRIVDVGRGLAKEEDLEMCHKLAALMGAEVGCSRPVAENNKWMPKTSYMGITGVQVKPDVILAMGVSGQVQHIGGINKAKLIVAINKDKAAPIFKNADFGLVGDMYKIVPALIEKLS